MRANILSAADLHTLSELDWVDSRRGIYREGEKIYVPVRSGYPCDLILRDRRRRGRGYQRLSDTIIFHGRRPTPAQIADVVGRERPECILYIPAHQGARRVPRYEVLYGTSGEVHHRESGISYWFDPSKVMFSQGNRGEKERIRSLISSSGRRERIADMFAGIGYFTLPAAAAGGKVHAIEINADAYRYLLKNIEENGLSDSIRAELGDCRDHLSGTYDRVIMGHFDAESYLPAVLPLITSDSLIHLHTLSPRVTAVENAIQEHGLEAVITVHRVKKYAPQIWHSVMDVMIV